jgi:hypothetical protein
MAIEDNQKAKANDKETKTHRQRRSEKTIS